jgi:hypothetical protein
MLQYQVNPFLEQGGGSVPVKRMLPYDYIVLEQKLLFPVHIDMEVRIFLVKIMECHILNAGYRVYKLSIDPRFVEYGMYKKDQYSSA